MILMNIDANVKCLNQPYPPQGTAGTGTEGSPTARQAAAAAGEGGKEIWEEESHGLTCIPRCSCPLNNVSDLWWWSWSW